MTVLVKMFESLLIWKQFNLQQEILKSIITTVTVTIVEYSRYVASILYYIHMSSAIYATECQTEKVIRIMTELCRDILFTS